MAKYITRIKQHQDSSNTEEFEEWLDSHMTVTKEILEVIEVTYFFSLTSTLTLFAHQATMTEDDFILFNNV